MALPVTDFATTCRMMLSLSHCVMVFMCCTPGAARGQLMGNILEATGGPGRLPIGVQMMRAPTQRMTPQLIILQWLKVGIYSLLVSV